jgi:hypothetical protein
MTRVKLSRLSIAPAIAVSALILCGSQLCAQPLPQAQGTFIVLDAPGANGTHSVSINPAGEILGAATYSSGPAAGFLLSPQGTFTTFNVPGATDYVYEFFGEGPMGSTLNPLGEATGNYNDVNGTEHGFVRDLLGAITTFDAPDADITPGDFGGTIPLAINPAGEITGYYFDPQFFAHGFVRDANGHVTEFDAPGASIDCGNGTFPFGINAAGQITGVYYDSVCSAHGFLRGPNGALTVVDIPGFNQTVPLAINDGGQIAGHGSDAATGAAHGFVRKRDGSFTTFDLPNVRDFENMDINPAGVVVGFWLDRSLVWHSFRRAADGTVTSIDVPGAGTGMFQGTFASGINPAGVIVGKYNDVNGAVHGFLLEPQ